MSQPWRDPAAPMPVRSVPDDFSPRSATMPVGRVALLLAVGYLLLLAGRSDEILDAAYGLPLAPGTETLIALAEAWNEALAALGIPDAAASLRGLLATGR
jgi:hypothetical protein